MTSLFGIYGVGGCGRGIMPVAREHFCISAETQLAFIDDSAAASGFNGHDVLTLEAFMDVPADERSIAIAIASPRARQTVAERCRAAGASFFEVRATTRG